MGKLAAPLLWRGAVSLLTEGRVFSFFASSLSLYEILHCTQNNCPSLRRGTSVAEGVQNHAISIQLLPGCAVLPLAKRESLLSNEVVEGVHPPPRTMSFHYTTQLSLFAKRDERSGGSSKSLRTCHPERSRRISLTA